MTGIPGSSTFSTPATALLIEQTIVSFSPAGTASTLSRRSTSIRAAAGSIVTFARTGMPSVSGPIGSWAFSPSIVTAGSFSIAAATRRSL